MTKDEKAEDYDRLQYEHTQLNQEFKSQKRANKKLQEQLLLHNVVVPKGTLCKCKKEFIVYNDREGLNVCTLCGESKLA